MKLIKVVPERFEDMWYMKLPYLSYKEFRNDNLMSVRPILEFKRELLRSNMKGLEKIYAKR